MHSTTHLDGHLDILGQQPLLQIYTQICLCFPVADASSQPAIIETLGRGMERLSASFPWIAYQVVNEGAKERNTGTFKIIPFKKTPPLNFVDLRLDSSTPTMDELRRANFPMSMLDETFVAPRNTVPGSRGESPSETTPVFLVRATSIIGGLLLTFLGQHQSMDGTGLGQVIHLFSKACRNEPFTSEELYSGNLPRRDLIPLLDDYKPGPEVARQILKPSPSTDSTNTTPAPPPCTWANFTFSAASLAALKSLATQALAPSTSYISTDDALTAFIWQSVTRARQPRLNPSTESKFARAVDVRHHMGVPETYPGLLQNMTYHGYTVQQLIEAPLGHVASELRSALDPQTSKLERDTRALATLLSRTPDKLTVSFIASVDMSAGLMLSSWVKQKCYEEDFGLGLGMPESVRRPRFSDFESLVYLLPKARDGAIAVAICLRDDDMARLRADEEFMKYGEFDG
ncbi:uncharacterized protein K452DRAFT_349240 [Aplosporella prunicola CBS 121167]|uniref:Trichothecene 3-O-acetyltransferase-like N-terminal domain-containing protein n=1 Tax=Aplosporella prunicola CBS 121167 TaxID=1176127 RepID=A0A6A6BP25_9PEZI|nr:uncharacterized protein K452DRAFT_349240 [Aplosporella prunicola CBS 121167]KAF2145842.1 hypothetical protein K452DRAFT_349240 [Aplosporella prunicola CBS 121167]